MEELKDLGISNPEEIKKKFNEINKELLRKAGVHFGRPYFNNATVAGLYRMFLKKLAKDLGKEITPYKSDYSWWMK